MAKPKATAWSAGMTLMPCMRSQAWEVKYGDLKHARNRQQALLGHVAGRAHPARHLLQLLQHNWHADCIAL